MDQDRGLLIGGSWVRDAGRERVDVENPATEELIGQVDAASIADADRAVAAAVRAFTDGPWPRLSFARRAEYLSRLAEGLRSRRDEFARLYVLDQGGVASFAPHIFGSAIGIVDYYARLGAEWQPGPHPRESSRGRVLIDALPVGPVFAGVPWNAPLVLAGCPVVIKSDPQTPLVPLLLAECLAELELPEGVVSLLVGDADVGRHLVSHPGVAHVSFTGSTQAGREVARAAANNFTRVTLELGGKGAAIVLDDLDPADATHLVYGNCLAQSGQVCTTSSRILVPEGRYDEWARALADMFAAFPVGDPADPATMIGPLVSARQRDRVEAHIAGARKDGATVLTGGGRPAGMARGYYVEPTLITDVRRDMAIVREEVFGPVIVVQAYPDEDEAIRIANDTEFGLANAVLTAEVDRGLTLAPRLRSGTVNINASGSCLTQPFGGFGHSGIGREGGPEGVEAFLEHQQIQIGS